MDPKSFPQETTAEIEDRYEARRYELAADCMNAQLRNTNLSFHINDADSLADRSVRFADALLYRLGRG